MMIYKVEVEIMFDIKVFEGISTKEKYDSMLTMLKSLLEDEKNVLTNVCNASALINALIGRVNWCGFYFIKDEELVLGPFQGMPACTRIKIGQGVCGTSAKEKKVMRIENVHDFQGHIACDAASNSELVIPIIKDEKVYGVLDLDSAEVGRFGKEEEEYLVKCVEIMNEYIHWERMCE